MAKVFATVAHRVPPAAAIGRRLLTLGPFHPLSFPQGG